MNPLFKLLFRYFFTSRSSSLIFYEEAGSLSISLLLLIRSYSRTGGEAVTRLIPLSKKHRRIRDILLIGFLVGQCLVSTAFLNILLCPIA